MLDGITDPGQRYLTRYGLVTMSGDIDQGQLGSGNGLLPDGTKPLTDPVLTS